MTNGQSSEGWQMYHKHDILGPMADIAEQPKKAILSSGMSLYEIAKQADLPYATVHGFAGGYRSLKIESAAAICRVLGLSLASRSQRNKKTR